MIVTISENYEGEAPPGKNEGVWAEVVLPGGKWFARGRMEVQGERVVVSELRLVSATTDKTPRGGINQEVVRSVPLGGFGPTALSIAEFASSLHPALRAAEPFDSQLRGFKGLLPARPRPRRSAGRDDLFFAELARDYLASIKGGSRSPVKDLAATRKEKASRIRDQVHEARERELLSKSESGRLGGVLLPRAIDILGATKKRVTVKRPKRRRK